MSIGGPLTAIVSNERSAAVLLPYESTIIDEVQRTIEEQEGRVKGLELNMESLDEIQVRFCQAMQLEVLRWKYMVQTYHSTRFKKIQGMVTQLMIPTQNKLCPAERSFCESIARSVEGAVGTGSVEFRSEEEDLSGFVFFQAQIGRAHV